MTLEEAKKYKQEVNEVCDYKKNQWFIVAFETGRLDGIGHGNVFSETYGSEVGEKIIVETEINDASQLKLKSKQQHFHFPSNLLVNHKGEAQTIASTAKLVGIYFSCIDYWCQECQDFTPVLADFYKLVNSNEKVLEIVFASTDRDEKSFTENFETMPWIALDFKERDLKEEWAQNFKINRYTYSKHGCPTFIVFNAEGDIVSKYGNLDVQRTQNVMGNIDDVLKKWLEHK